ncbi:MAG TPA: DUF5615 family PIN-like protein [Polyangia bacterium]|nr:DUF5615 family PIN-like protein [Polyangia bacterium]
MSNSRGGTCAPILGSVGLVNPPKLLLDENLSPSIAVTLTREGYDVVHVRDRGLLQATDAQVFARAFDEDRIVVTFNCDDFKTRAGCCGARGVGVLRGRRPPA